MATHVEEAQDLLRESRAAMAGTRWDEARVAAERAAALDPEDPEILEAWTEAALFSGDRESTFHAGERAFRRFRELDDGIGAARVANLIAGASYDFTGDIPVARGWIARALRVLEGEGPSRELALTYGFDGHLAIFREQRPAHALERAEQTAGIARALDDVGLEMTAVALQGLALSSVGRIDAGTRGDAERAKTALEDAVDLFLGAGTPFEEAEARAALASVLAGMGDEAQAEAEAEAAERTFARLGATGNAAQAAALIHAGPPVAPRDPAGISRREREILVLIASGRTNGEIAGDLFLSVRTVERHVSNIYAKLDVSGRTARVVAAEHARRLGLA